MRPARRTKLLMVFRCLGATTPSSAASSVGGRLDSITGDIVKSLKIWLKFRINLLHDDLFMVLNSFDSSGRVCRLVVLSGVVVALLGGCGGSSSSQVAVGDDGSEAAGSLTRRQPCSAAQIPSTGYSLVFKGCNIPNVSVAEYYDKSECVRDNATGLIWQGQTPAGTGLRANDRYKSNFDSTQYGQTHRYGKIPGWGNIGWYAESVTQAEIDAEDNSIGFQNTVNASKLCGFSDWRLPNLDELRKIVKQRPVPPSRLSSPQIDVDWFTNFPEYSSAGYWSSTPWGGGTGPIVEYINFNNGIGSKQWREDYKAPGFSVPVYLLVRLVRSPTVQTND
jgi:Protein of unknown function (DUF1566)